MPAPGRYKPRSPDALGPPPGMIVRLKPVARAESRRQQSRDEWQLWVPALLDAWREITVRGRRSRVLLTRGLERRARHRLQKAFRHWLVAHHQAHHRELEKRMQRQAEARAAAEGRALVRLSIFPWFASSVHSCTDPLSAALNRLPVFSPG